MDHEKLGARRIVALSSQPEEKRRLESLQDGKCSEGGCDGVPQYKLEEKMAHGWTTLDFLCVNHAEEWATRMGLDRF